MKYSKEYLNYLRSKEWSDLRIDLITSRKRCERCGSSKRLEVHHLTYDRLGQEEPSDLELLCKNCHKIEHGKAIKSHPRKSKKQIKIRVKMSSSRKRQEFYKKYGI